ncbi:MAG: ABC transporter ATP-binding protein [Candidatus Fermentibacteraceae bacterium]
MRIDLQGISRTVGAKQIVSDVSFSVEQGDFCTLIGPTGCGKTTLLRIADLLERPTRGKVLLDGNDCTGWRGRSRTALRRRMSMVMQRPFMLTGSVERNVRFGPGVRGTTVSHTEMDEVLDATGLSGMGHRNARTLSGGEMQKVAIARAVITKPELLLLDEPLNSVDQGFKPELRALIGRLHHEMGITVLMATHDLADALALSNRTVVLSEGRLMQAGETAKVFSHPESLFVASFTGMKNIVPVRFGNGTATAGDVVFSLTEQAQGGGYICIPPEVIVLSREKPDSSQRNTFKAVVSHLESMPMYDTVHILLKGLELQSSVSSESTLRLGLEAGSEVWVSFKATSVRVLG